STVCSLWYGRMFMASCPTKPTVSDVSWHRLPEKPEVLYSLQGEGGRTRVECLVPKGVKSRGERSKLRHGEFPSVAKESSLWQILEDLSQDLERLQRYCLSSKASAGVLRRAS